MFEFLEVAYDVEMTKKLLREKKFPELLWKKR